jgi:hypothetical protein
MTCKGICIRHKASSNNYANRQKRCQVCELFIKWDGLCCPCCRYRLRTKPRNVVFKRRLTEANTITVLTPRVDRPKARNDLGGEGRSIKMKGLNNRRKAFTSAFT